MSISPSFLFGLAAVLLSEVALEWLPGEATPGTLAAAALVLPLPHLWANVTGKRLRQLAEHGGRPGPLLWLLLRLQPLAVAIAMLVLTAFGGLLPLAEQLAPDSWTLQFAMVLAPLTFLELSMRSVERRTVGWIEQRGLDVPESIGAGFVGMTLLVVVAVLLFGLALDVIALDRWLEVFFHATALGMTVGTLLMVLGLSSLLPLLFRFVLPTTRKLPDRVAGDVRDAAARLRFSPRHVVALQTDMRMVNAALVGPLRWPRYLVLTDGILALLDVTALRGVVAHEVGHARAGHPAWLLAVFAMVPLLLVKPLGDLDLDGVDPLLLVAVGGALALVVFWLLRALMHRFEYEADQLSAVALGGALPCITALRRVGDLFPSQRGRSSFRHPSEEERVRNMTLWDTDAGYRAAFARRGRAARVAIVAVLVLATAASTEAHLRTAPLDRATLRLYTGDFAGAGRALDTAADDVDPVRRDQLRAEVDAARALLPGGGAWESIRDELGSRAWRRALDTLRSSGVAAARPFFALALVSRDAGALRASAWLWAAAAAERDDDRAKRLAAHLATFPDLPPELARAAG